MPEYFKTYADFAPPPVQPDTRQALIDAFTERPDDDAVWDTAYTWVRAEGDSQQAGVAGSIPANELIGLAETVRAADPAQRYDLMAEKALDGRLWFDAIEGFSPVCARQVLQRLLDESVQQNGSRFFRALDIGTGTGKSLAVAEQNAKTVVGVDRNPALLAVAKQRAGSHTSLVQAEITSLPFDDDSFDIITSLGVEGALDKATSRAFYRELARVLMPGTSYITAFSNYPHLPSEEMAQLTQTSKAMLADMIGDTVSGGAHLVDSLNRDELDELFIELGLHEEYYDDVSEDSKTHLLIKVVTKAP